jgi:hypothetical protein
MSLVYSLYIINKSGGLIYSKVGIASTTRQQLPCAVGTGAHGAGAAPCFMTTQQQAGMPFVQNAKCITSHDCHGNTTPTAHHHAHN